ncbi:MAG: beta-N-acetylhexosaminidase, partial [Clostridia bacterium]|nr:beta-N-acetylhexosaminidase [Clostridia bacterium]
MDKQLRHQIGQMIIAGFPSLEVDDQARALVSDYQVGNFILFARNMNTAEQVANMCGGLSDMTFEKTGLAPFIAADQEGGLVSRITEGAALFPGAMALAAAADEAEIRQVGKNCGEMLRAMGVNVNFAPVLDVNIEPLNPIIGIRSFGDEPQRVADLGSAMAEGMVEGGVIATLKHYPGHGNVAVDSHLDLPTNDTDPALLENTEFLPFKQAFDRGAPAIMSCHIRFPKIDPDLPATLSPAILTDLLRKKQGFQGLVFTDCMEMEAIQKGWGSAEGAVLAVLAGCDILCISHHVEAVRAACDAIYEAVQSGRIPRARIQETYDRIVAAKTRMGLTHKQEVRAQQAHELVYAPEKVELHKRLSRSSVT